MSIVALCPKCDKSFGLPDDARGDYTQCPECDHLFPVNLEPTPAIRLGVPAISTTRDTATGIQHGSSALSTLPAIDESPNQESGPSVERGLGSILTMLGVRFSSPFAWLGALALFFLPWVEIRCFDKQGKLTHHSTHSGAQLAWGGGNDVTPEREEEKKPDQKNEVIIAPGAIRIAPDAIKPTWNEMVATWVLSIYFAALVCGLALKAICFMLAPYRFRAGFGAFLAFALLLLPLVGMWFKWGNPLYLRSDAGIIAEYTIWYYASYVVNLWAILSFAIEFWLTRKTSVRVSRYEQSETGDP